jgi:hypothetical protein
VYHSDVLFPAHGHAVIWLPLYTCGLNPSELALHQIKDYVRFQNMTADCKSLYQRGKDCDKEDWASYCCYVTNIDNLHGWK